MGEMIHLVVLPAFEGDRSFPDYGIVPDERDETILGLPFSDIEQRPNVLSTAPCFCGCVTPTHSVPLW